MVAKYKHFRICRGACTQDRSCHGREQWQPRTANIFQIFSASAVCGLPVFTNKLVLLPPPTRNSTVSPVSRRMDDRTTEYHHHHHHHTISPRRSFAGQGVPSSPINSGSIISSSGITRYGSISTLATSAVADNNSEWGKRHSSVASMRIDYEEPEQRVTLPKSQRPKGHYSLSDFYIHRTLGTGSFGRVHLGEFLLDQLN